MLYGHTYAPMSAHPEIPVTPSSSRFERVCCLPLWLYRQLRSRHLITWLLLVALLAGVGLVLLVYIVPLAEKANVVADEARELVKVALEKVNRVDADVRVLIDDTETKVTDIHSGVSGLVDTAHTRLENIDATVHSFVRNTTREINTTLTDVHTDISGLIDSAQEQLDDMQVTVDGFVLNATLGIDRMEQSVNRTLEDMRAASTVNVQPGV
jgi:F0F1-type ATP synthase membrane subunit b/b'